MNQYVPVCTQHSHPTSGEKPQCFSPERDETTEESEGEMHRLRQALQRANTELEGQLTHAQKELENERKRAQTCKERFMDLAKNHRAIIWFMEEYKRQNSQLKVENSELQLENKSLFSKKVKEKEEMIQNLLEENKELRELHTNMEKEYRCVSLLIIK